MNFIENKENFILFVVDKGSGTTKFIDKLHTKMKGEGIKGLFIEQNCSGHGKGMAIIS